MKQTFPEGFLWGAATAAHQVEGNNIHSDMWLMEHLEHSSFKERSGDACDHYRLYREDIQTLAGLGFNSYRFSIEWARIEPEEGHFDPEAVEHYRDVLLACTEHNLTPIVTLLHFTSPQWLISAGGWESPDTPARFARYCEFVMRELGSLIPFVCTINEANMGVGITKIIKRYSKNAGAAQVGINLDQSSKMKEYYTELGQAFQIDPREVHPFLAPHTEEGNQLIFRAHQEARAAIRRVSPSTRVGLTLSLYDIQAEPGGEEYAAEALREEFLDFLPYLEEDDFFGLQNYTRAIYGPEGMLPFPVETEKTQMGYDFWPQGLEAVIRYAFKYTGKPIMVTENGIGTDDDERRIAFVNRALEGVHACVKEGLPVIGYMHWSLMDNFEWQLGFSRTFGLISVDRESQNRTLKPSAYHLGIIARTNQLN